MASLHNTLDVLRSEAHQKAACISILEPARTEYMDSETKVKPPKYSENALEDALAALGVPRKAELEAGQAPRATPSDWRYCVPIVKKLLGDGLWETTLNYLNMWFSVLSNANFSEDVEMGQDINFQHCAVDLFMWAIEVTEKEKIAHTKQERIELTLSKAVLAFQVGAAVERVYADGSSYLGVLGKVYEAHYIQEQAERGHLHPPSTQWEIEMELKIAGTNLASRRIAAKKDITEQYENSHMLYAVFRAKWERLERAKVLMAPRSTSAINLAEALFIIQEIEPQHFTRYISAKQFTHTARSVGRRALHREHKLARDSELLSRSFMSLSNARHSRGYGRYASPNDRSDDERSNSGFSDSSSVCSRSDSDYSNY